MRFLHGSRVLRELQDGEVLYLYLPQALPVVRGYFIVQRSQEVSAVPASRESWSVWKISAMHNVYKGLEFNCTIALISLYQLFNALLASKTEDLVLCRAWRNNYLSWSLPSEHYQGEQREGWPRVCHEGFLRAASLLTLSWIYRSRPPLLL